MSIDRFAEDRLLAPAKIARAFMTTAEDIARTAGLGKDAVSHTASMTSQDTQKRLRAMVEIIDRVKPRFGSDVIAYAWYRSEPLPGFSGQTAMQLARANRAADVLDYIDAVDAGVHA